MLGSRRAKALLADVRGLDNASRKTELARPRDPDLLIPLAVTQVRQSAWTTTTKIPNDRSLVGGQVALQAIIGPTNAPLGFDLSAGGVATFGR